MMIKIWDLPTRLFHWILVFTVSCSIVSGYIGGNAMVWHFRFGLTVFSLLCFRLIWGVVGGHWSRFASFGLSPTKVLHYVRGRDELPESVGHNPLGSISVVLFLVFLCAQVSSGFFSDDEIAFTGPLTKFVSEEWVSWCTEYHKEVGKIVLFVLIGTHVAAICFYRFKKKIDLVRPMIHGNKEVATEVTASRDSKTTRWLALVIFVVCASAAWWISRIGN